MEYGLRQVKTDGEWRDYHAIRRSVLWEARGKYTYDDKHADEYLPANHPLLLFLDNHPAGTTRLDDFGNGTGVVRLVAISVELQRRGHGRELAKHVENYARSLGLHTLFVNAAPDALGYYERLGWQKFEWDKTELRGIASDCVQMRKGLDNIGK